jgi:hypothetical protein
MKDKINNIDDLFRDKVYDYSTPPPGSVWNNIELNLGNNKRKKLIFFYFKIAAGFIFLAGLTALYIKIVNTHTLDVIKPVIVEKVIITEGKQYDYFIQPSPQIESKLAASKKQISRKSELENHSNNIINESEPISENSVALNNSINSNITAQTASKNNLNLMSGIKPTIKQKTDSEILMKKDFQSKEKVIENANDALFDDLLADDEPAKNKNLEWSVGGQAGPQYTYRKLTNETQIATGTTDYDSYDSPMLAYAGGLQIEVEPLKRLSVQSGVYYSKVGQKISSRYIETSKNDYFTETNTRGDTRPVEIVNSIGTLSFSDNAESAQNNIIEGQPDNAFAPINSSMEKADYTGQQYFEFIEIPLILKFKVIDQKLGVNLIGGLNSDILVNNTAKVTNSSNVTLESTTSDINTFNYSGTVGFGFEYPLSKNMLFSLEPFFKYYLSSINKSSVNDAHPYMIGIMTGVNYSF